MSDDTYSVQLGKIGSVFFGLVLSHLRHVADGFNSLAWRTFVLDSDWDDFVETIESVWCNGEANLLCGDDDGAAECLVSGLVWEGLSVHVRKVVAFDGEFQFGLVLQGNEFLRLEFLPAALAEIQFEHFDVLTKLLERVFEAKWKRPLEVV